MYTGESIQDMPSKNRIPIIRESLIPYFNAKELGLCSEAKSCQLWQININTVIHPLFLRLYNNLSRWEHITGFVEFKKAK